METLNTDTGLRARTQGGLEVENRVGVLRGEVPYHVIQYNFISQRYLFQHATEF